MSLKEVLEKKFGKGSIVIMGDKPVEPIKCISTGIDVLDNTILGCGGVPEGRMLEFLGEESSGKTTLALIVTAQFQKHGHTVLFVDTEHALSMEWAVSLGVNPTKLAVCQPDNGEQALEIIDAAIKSEYPPGLIVVDSVAALTPKAELEGEMGDSNMGLHARLMSQACRKLTGSLAKSKTTIIWVNQTRDKIGIVYGNPSTTTGGKALRFYASIRLQIKRSKAIKNGEEIIGHGIHIKCIKNKLAAPFKECELPFYYAGGLDNTQLKLDQLINSGEVEVSGKWYIYQGKKYNGKAKMLEALAEPNNKQTKEKEKQNDS